MKRKESERRSGRQSPKRALVGAVDLFCGVGGLTKGLEKAGIEVRLGVDIDPSCQFPFTANNDAEFLLKSVADVVASDLANATARASFTLLAGCAPCQPFSTYQQKSDPSDGRWRLLEHFARLAEEIEPDLITMENVPNLQKQVIFRLVPLSPSVAVKPACVTCSLRFGHGLRNDLRVRRMNRGSSERAPILFHLEQICAVRPGVSGSETEVFDCTGIFAAVETVDIRTSYIAASGQAAAPLRSVMKSRRLM